MKKILLGLIFAYSTSTYALDAYLTAGHMKGVQKGWTYDYDTILVGLATSTESKHVKPTIWWFYTNDKKDQSISYDRYYDKKFTKIHLNENDADAEGNLYVYGKFIYRTGQLPTSAKALADLVAGGIETFVPSGGLINAIYKDGKLPSGAAPNNAVRFEDTWFKSDQPININKIKSGESQTISFFKEDMTFTVEQ